MSKKDKKEKAKVNSKLAGFNVSINSFGEIKSSKPVDDLNAFLDKNVVDKKLTGKDGQNPLSG